MKTMMLAAAAVTLAAVNTASALAETPRAGGGAAISQTASRSMSPHYEWQYHYGKKARFEGHWILMR